MTTGSASDAVIRMCRVMTTSGIPSCAASLTSIAFETTKRRWLRAATSASKRLLPAPGGPDHPNAGRTACQPFQQCIQFSPSPDQRQSAASWPKHIGKPCRNRTPDHFRAAKHLHIRAENRTVQTHPPAAPVRYYHGRVNRRSIIWRMRDDPTPNVRLPTRRFR